jgi:antitoxin component HigA of HigAB toxin-antitoxin module
MKVIKAIQSEVAYQAALERLEELIAQNPKKGTAVYVELDKLGSLLVAYEELHYPI